MLILAFTFSAILTSFPTCIFDVYIASAHTHLVWVALRLISDHKLCGNLAMRMELRGVSSIWDDSFIETDSPTHIISTPAKQ